MDHDNKYINCKKQIKIKDKRYGIGLERFQKEKKKIIKTEKGKKNKLGSQAYISFL